MLDAINRVRAAIDGIDVDGFFASMSHEDRLALRQALRIVARSPMAVEARSIDAITPYERNSRAHPPEQVEQIARSISEFGWGAPILIDEDGVIIAGHGRLAAARLIRDRGGAIPGWPDVTVAPVIVRDHMTAAQRRAYRIADNQLGLTSHWDEAALRIEIADLRVADFDLSILGFDPDTLTGYLTPAAPDGSPAASSGGGGQVRPVPLADRFGVPPFSVLSARDGWWRGRKAAWLALGIKSEIGRGAHVAGAQDEEAA